MLATNDLLFLTVVFISNIIQCITGFAGTVLAMPVSLMLVGYAVAKPVLNALGAAASVGVVASAPRRVNFGEFAKMLSLMLAGMLAGTLIQTFCELTAGSLYIMLGVAVIAFTVIGFLNEFVFKKPMASLLPRHRKGAIDVMDGAGEVLTLLLAGLVHGMFVCGGPLLVLYADRVLKDKQEFRTTLSAVWIVLNGIILINDALAGYFVPSTVTALAFGMIALLAAALVGNLIAQKLSRKVFMIITYILMLVSGISPLAK